MSSVTSVFFESTPLFLTGVFVLGLLVGSFLNVVILRLPARLQHDWQCQCRELLELEAVKSPAPPGLVYSRSQCPACSHQITALENIPVISYFFLRGRCSGCNAKISARYPIVELITGGLFLSAGLVFGPSGECLGALVLLAFLVALTGIDIDHQLLPDNLTLPLIWLGLVASLFMLYSDPVSSIVGGITGYLFLWLVFHVFRLLTGKEGMGYGDFKLMAAMGAWLGWQMLPLIILLSALVGAVIGTVFLSLKGRSEQQPIPFGPFIASAGVVALLWGDQILNAYLVFSGLAP